MRRPAADSRRLAASDQEAGRPAAALDAADRFANRSDIRAWRVSDGSALATCTAALCRMFEDALGAADLGPSLGGTPTVSALPPDRIIVGAGEQPQLNLFLYRSTPNTYADGQSARRGVACKRTAIRPTSGRPPAASSPMFQPEGTPCS
jgi:hypothetical protein